VILAVVTGERQMRETFVFVFIDQVKYALHIYMYIYIYVYTCTYMHKYIYIYMRTSDERWGAGVKTQKNLRGEIGGWG